LDYTTIKEAWQALICKYSLKYFINFLPLAGIVRDVGDLDAKIEKTDAD